MNNKPRTKPIKKISLDGLNTEQKETVLKLSKIQKELFNKDLELNISNDKNNNILDFYKIYQYIDENPNYTDKEVTILINDLYDRVFKRKSVY